MPWFLLVPHRQVQYLAGSIQILFQSILILSGNLSFLNWLTILPALMCFDDAAVSVLFSKTERKRAIAAINEYQKSQRDWKLSWRFISITCRRLLSVSASLSLLYISYPVIVNIFSPNQLMNASFGAFRIVNTYGAFGSVTKVRHEVLLHLAILPLKADSQSAKMILILRCNRLVFLQVILQGTNESMITRDTKWLDYNFNCKPGDIDR